MLDDSPSSTSVASKMDDSCPNLDLPSKINRRDNYYFAYGLKIKSAFKLPELIGYNQTDFDVEIKREAIERSPLSNLDEYFFCCESTPAGLYLFWQGLGMMLISGGKSITIDPVVDFDEARLRLFILGAALGAILHQRGYIVLHASAVAIAGQGVVFTAPKGEGKSTMTATLHRQGHSFIADDVVAIDFSNPDTPLIYPAFPQLKLWPDAVTQIGKNPEDLPKLISRLEKRDYLFEDFDLQPVPLQQIFALNTAQAISIETLTPQEILLTLLRNIYVARFGSSLLPAKNPAFFLKLTQFAQRVSLLKLSRPRDLALVAQVATTVEKYIGADSNSRN
ncbi:MAG: hypothetical protein AAF652_08690 [Cyanobacteria bacterium P01_C01_bin.72]